MRHFLRTSLLFAQHVTQTFDRRIWTCLNHKWPTVSILKHFAISVTRLTFQDDNIQVHRALTRSEAEI
jgi:hypothetical protein